ncbi:MAG TPA: phosphatidylinositol mannoside acyltransferase [Frankiaceae bacterium]|nr:phosphatidylinositol mannoside acyltransferase [Frankiaceae bacterium]
MPKPRSRVIGARDQLIVLGYRLGWGLLRAVPERFARAAFRVGADLAWRRRGKGILRLRSNLARVLGPEVSSQRLDQVTREAVRSYARYWMEIFRLSVIPQDEIISRMDLAGEDRLWTAMQRGQGLVVALPHMGNWDHAGAWLVLRGIPFTTVAERLEPAEVFDRFVAFRESLGMEVLPLTGGASPPFRILADRLRAGGAMCLLSDRDLSRHGVAVQFFGARATMPAGPARLALDTGATLLPAVLWFENGGWGCQVYPPVDHTDVATMTQELADAYAEAIAEHPQDWHMLQRLWSDDLEPGRRPAAAADPDHEVDGSAATGGPAAV